MAEAMRLKDLAVTRSDLFRLDPRIIVARDGWNVRLPGPELEAHITGLMESIRAVGVLQPLTVQLKAGTVYLTDGFCRHAAVMRLIAEGADIKSVPTISEPPHGNEADQVLSMCLRNAGKPLAPLETAEVFRRLMAYGWTTRDISTKAGCSTSHVENLLRLNAASPAVREMVASGEVAASTVVDVLRTEGDNAERVLREAKATAQAEGQAKVKPRHLDPSRPRWGKVGPTLREHLQKITSATSPLELEAAMLEAQKFLLETFK